MDTSKILTIGIAVVVVAAAAGVVLWQNNNKTSKELVDLEGWEDILKDANGQSITIGFYVADPAIQKVFYPDHIQKEIKDKYNITVEAKSYGPAAANTAREEIEKGENNSFDLIWGDTSAYAAMTNNGKNCEYVYSTAKDGKQWLELLPNYYYLKSNHEDTISSQFSNYIKGTAMQFSNGQTMFVYNQDFNVKSVKLGDKTVDVPYDCVIIYGENESIKAVVKVTGDGTNTFSSGKETTLTAQTESAFKDAWSKCTTAYNIESVRSVLAGSGAKGVIAYGLPSTFTDLASWVKIYDGQFSYPAFDNAGAVFHTNLLLQAAIYELTWDGKGWKAAENREENIKKVNEALKDVAKADDSAKSDVFAEKFGYVYKYLKDIEPYLHDFGSGTKYLLTGNITEYNKLIVGNNSADKDYADGTVMLAMSTVTSIDARVKGSPHSLVDQYSYNAGVFSLSTGCYSDYYCFIPKNTQHLSAAMVVANWLIDPLTQFNWYTKTGNGMNIDFSKEMYNIETGKSLGYTVKEFYEFDEQKLSSYTLSLSVDVLEKVTVASDFTPYQSVAIDAWVKNVKQVK